MLAVLPIVGVSLITLAIGWLVTIRQRNEAVARMVKLRTERDELRHKIVELTGLDPYRDPPRQERPVALPIPGPPEKQSR